MSKTLTSLNEVVFMLLPWAWVRSPPKTSSRCPTAVALCQARGVVGREIDGRDHVQLSAKVLNPVRNVSLDIETFNPKRVTNATDTGASHLEMSPEIQRNQCSRASAIMEQDNIQNTLSSAVKNSQSLVTHPQVLLTCSPSRSIQRSDSVSSSLAPPKRYSWPFMRVVLAPHLASGTRLVGCRRDHSTRTSAGCPEEQGAPGRQGLWSGPALC